MSGVGIIPGDTALTRIVGAYSSAAEAVSAATAALAAAYGASPAAGRVPEIDDGRHDRAAARLQDQRRDRLEPVEHAGEVERRRSGATRRAPTRGSAAIVLPPALL